MGKVKGQGERGDGGLEKEQDVREKRGEGWFDKECREKRKKVKEQMRLWRKGKQEKQKYVKEKAEYKELCEKKKGEERDRFIREVGSARTDKEVWEIVNRQRKQRKGINEEIKIEEWEEYFRNILGGVEWRVVRGGERKEGKEVLERKEFEEALRGIKKNKAKGVDGIQGEGWKYAGKGVKDAAWKVCEGVWKGQGWPEDWIEGLVVPIRKKGTGKKVEEYRGVTIMPTLYKVYAAMLNRRIEKVIEEEGMLPENQAGFRKGRGTVDNIYILNWVINEGIAREGGKIILLFVDFKAAFDGVNREALWESMEGMGIKEELVERVKEIYKETRSRVRVGRRKEEGFWMGRGVRQGCPLSPKLFNCLIADMEKVIENAGGGVRIGGGRKIHTLAYADDVVLMAEDEGSMVRMMGELKEYVGRKGLQINVGKTKIMRCSKGGGRKKEMEWRWGREKIEEIKEFRLLCSVSKCM